MSKRCLGLSQVWFNFSNQLHSYADLVHGLSFLRSQCKLQRDTIAKNPELEVSDDLLKTFLNLHHPAFSEATLSNIVIKGGPKAFDFRGHVMFFGLTYRNDNPGTAFSIGVAECVPTSVLYQHLPIIKDMLQAMEERYDSVAAFDKATMENFAGLIRVVYQAGEVAITKNVPIRDNPEGDAANRATWLSELQFAVDNGLVGKDVGGTYQMGKIIKQGTRWKWTPLPGLSSSFRMFF
jgi:hypothetical protein